MLRWLSCIACRMSVAGQPAERPAQPAAGLACLRACALAPPEGASSWLQTSALLLIASSSTQSCSMPWSGNGTRQPTATAASQGPLLAIRSRMLRPRSAAKYPEGGGATGLASAATRPQAQLLSTVPCTCARGTRKKPTTRRTGASAMRQGR